MSLEYLQTLGLCYETRAQIIGCEPTSGGVVHIEELEPNVHVITGIGGKEMTASSALAGVHLEQLFTTGTDSHSCLVCL